MRTCGRCGVKLDPCMRADARFCSTRCRMAHHRANRLPAELVGLDRWVRWKPIRRNSRWTKMPLRPDGRSASSTDRRTWSSHSGAKAASPDGRLGFVLGAGVGCIDLDHCLIGDGRTGNAAPTVWAQAVLDSVDTYVEVSPSGDGLHVWGLLPEAAGRVIRDGRSIEVYATARFMTVTGLRWGKAPSHLADLSGLVESL